MGLGKALFRHSSLSVVVLGALATRGKPKLPQCKRQFEAWHSVCEPGHPITSIASANSNLRIVCFELNTEGNTRYLLAGENNIASQMEEAAKELGFNAPAREVESVFQRQDKKLFYPGPERREEEQGRPSA